MNHDSACAAHAVIVGSRIIRRAGGAAGNHRVGGIEARS
jgi:hypothetical protein